MAREVSDIARDRARLSRVAVNEWDCMGKSAGSDVDED
jgi:hypothetical protein